MIHSQFERGSSSSAPSGTPVDSHLRRLYSAQEVLLEFSFVVLLLACFLLVTFASRLLRDDACCNGSVTVWRFLKSYAEDAKQPICFVPFNLNGVYQMQANHTQLPWEVQRPRARQYAEGFWRQQRTCERFVYTLHVYCHKHILDPTKLSKCLYSQNCILPPWYQVQERVWTRTTISCNKQANRDLSREHFSFSEFEILDLSVSLA